MLITKNNNNKLENKNGCPLRLASGTFGSRTRANKNILVTTRPPAQLITVTIQAETHKLVTLIAPGQKKPVTIENILLITFK